MLNVNILFVRNHRGPRLLQLLRRDACARRSNPLVLGRRLAGDPDIETVYVRALTVSLSREWLDWPVDKVNNWRNGE